MSEVSTTAIEAIKQSDDGLSRWFILEPTGLRATDEAMAQPPPTEAWVSLMHTLNGMTESLPRWRADAYLLGELWYGAVFASSVFDPLKWKIGTWLNNVSVRRRLGDRWHDNLDYSLHDAVSSLEPDQQQELLDEAERDSLRVSQLRMKVRVLKAKAVGANPLMVTGGPVDRLRKLVASTCKLYSDMPDDWVDVRALLDEAVDKFNDALEIVEDFDKEQRRMTA